MHRTDDSMDEFRILQYSSVTTINWTKPQVSIFFWKMKLRRMEGLSFRMLIMQIFCLLLRKWQGFPFRYVLSG